MESIRTKQTLFKKAVADKTTWLHFKKYRNTLTRVIQLAKQIHFKSKITQSKANPKILWKTVNDIVNLKQGKNNYNINIQTDSGHIEKNQEKVSNILNKHFTTVGTKLREKIASPSPNCTQHHISSSVKKCDNSVFLNPMSVYDVKRYIKNLDSNKSTKSDYPTIKLIKQCANVISPMIAKIFNKCIKDGIFPDLLKDAEVVPIFKKGSKVLPGNYRPISLLSPFSKIFERHLYDQINKFLTKNKILYNFQYGFRNNSSTEIALSQICEDLATRMENSSIACSVFVDLAKAFDTVDHEILVSKLHLYGVRGLPGRLICSYLSNRHQITVANGIKSDARKITCGVPQGSILGPLLFLLYINDLPNVSSFNIKLFADDACLLLDHKDPKILQELVNNELVKINDWMKLNKLTINYDKTNYIIFTNKKLNTNVNIKLEGHTLKQVKETKYLGVILNEKLNWEPHISFIRNKLVKASYLLSKLRHYVDISTLKMIYYSLVHSHISYCITTWGGAPPTTIKPLITIQNKIIRIITFSHYKTHAPPLFLKLSILQIDDIYRLHLALLIHKISNNQVTGTHNLININNVHNHNTRLSKNNFWTQSHNTNLGLSTYSAKGIKIWKELPNNIKTLRYTTFKYKVKQYIMESNQKSTVFKHSF